MLDLAGLHRGFALRRESVLQSASNCRLARTAEACKPKHTAFLVQYTLLVAASDHGFMPLDVRCLIDIVSGRLHNATGSHWSSNALN